MQPIPEHAHCMNCDADDCAICHSKLVEIKQRWDYVWFLIVSHTDYPDPENHDLGEYDAG